MTQKRLRRKKGSEAHTNYWLIKTPIQSLNKQLEQIIAKRHRAEVYAAFHRYIYIPGNNQPKYYYLDETTEVATKLADRSSPMPAVCASIVINDMFPTLPPTKRHVTPSINKIAARNLINRILSNKNNLRTLAYIHVARIWSSDIDRKASNMLLTDRNEIIDIDFDRTFPAFHLTPSQIAFAEQEHKNDCEQTETRFVPWRFDIHYDDFIAPMYCTHFTAGNDFIRELEEKAGLTPNTLFAQLSKDELTLQQYYIFEAVLKQLIMPEFILDTALELFDNQEQQACFKEIRDERSKALYDTMKQCVEFLDFLEDSGHEAFETIKTDLTSEHICKHRYFRDNPERFCKNCLDELEINYGNLCFDYLPDLIEDSTRVLKQP